MEQLREGAWPKLTKSNLGSNRLDTDAIIWLITAKWPVVTSLELGLNRLTAASMEALASSG